MLIDKIGEILVDKYSSEQGFVSAYAANSQKVFQVVVRRMKVVPIDLKVMLANTYKALTTQSADPENTTA